MENEEKDTVNWARVYALVIGFLIVQLVFYTWITLRY